MTMQNGRATTRCLFGRRAVFPVAELKYATRLAALRWAQGRFAEMAATAREGRDRFTGVYLMFPLFHAIALADLGRREEAQGELERFLSDGVSSRYGPVHRESVAVLLAELCWLLEEAGPAPLLREALDPFAGGHHVVGIMTHAFGAMDRSLGQLATLQHRFDDADRHFRAAHRLHERLGAPWWLARGWVDHARMLLARGVPGDDVEAMDLLGRAKERFEALGADAYAERAAALLQQSERSLFRLEADEWDIRFGGRELRLRDSKGLQCLAYLLSRPGEQVHALELSDVNPSPSESHHERRLRELQSEIDGVRAQYDLGRLERAEDEFDELLARMLAATATPGAERARQSVTRAVKGAIERIAAGHPSLGEHLRTTVRTCAYSSYTPDARTPHHMGDGVNHDRSPRCHAGTACV